MKKWLLILCTLLFGAMLLLYPQEASAAVREGLNLCFHTVLPALFPFFVVTNLLIRLHFADLLEPLFAPLMAPLFHLRGVCAMPLLAGLLGGYPTGAKSAADLYAQGIISRQEAELLLGFCNNCGLSFLLSYVGAAILGSTAAGTRLFLIHTTAALLTGMILCRLCRSRGPALLPCRLPQEPVHFPKAFTAAVTGAFSSVLNICAYVVLFRAAAAILPLPAQSLGILEIVSGIAALSKGREGFVMAAAITAWGGLSVHCQTMSVAEGLSLKWHWLGKLVQALLAAAIAIPASQIFS